jgi:hypothetical protein
MLIEKRSRPEINDIVTLKLVSGEEIVGKLVEKTNDSVFLAKPVQIIMQPMAHNKMGLAFHPVLGSVENTTMQFPLVGMTIRPVKTGDDVSNNYIQATTGLITAKADERGILTP